MRRTIYGSGLGVVLAAVVFACLPVADSAALPGRALLKDVKVTVQNEAGRVIRIVVDLPGTRNDREWDLARETDRVVAWSQEARARVVIGMRCSDGATEGVDYQNWTLNYPTATAVIRDYGSQHWVDQGRWGDYKMHEGDTKVFWDKTIRVHRLDDSDEHKRFTETILRRHCVE